MLKPVVRSHVYFHALLFWVGVCTFGASPTWGRSPGQDSLDEGTALYQQERYEEALSAFKRATDLDPGLLRAWESVGWTYTRLNKTSEAIHTWEMLLKIDPKKISLLNEIGVLHLKEKAWEKAITAYNRSLLVQPNQPKSLLRLGEAYQSLGRYEEAAKQYNAALKLQPGDFETIRRLAAMYEAMDQGSKALALLEKALSRDTTLSSDLAPSLGRLYAQRGDRLFSAKDYPQAETAYRTALRWNPSHALSWANLGWSKRQQGDLSAAIEMWRKALAVDPNRRQLYTPLADALVELGKISEAHSWYTLAWQSGRREPGIPYHLAELAFHEKNLPLASQWLTTLFALPDFGEKWPFRVANLTINHNQPEMGIGLLKNRIALGSKDEGDHKALSRLYIFQGNATFKEGLFEQAVERYGEALQHDPENTTALRDLGWAYWRTGQWATCEETWKRYRSLSPDQPAPHNLLTQFYLFRKSYPEAIASATASLELSPDQPDQKLKRAKAFFWSAQYMKAKEEAEALAAAYPDHLPIQIFWGDLLMQYHDFRRSLKQWQKVLNLGSDLPKVRASWIVSMYELGKPEAALKEAQKAIETLGPQEPFLKFMANDAIAQNNLEKIIHWYQLLTEHFPQRPSFWIELASYQHQQKRFADALETLRQARRHHPNHMDILLALLEAEQSNGNTESAYQEYVDLALKYPSNRRIYMGKLYALIEKKRFLEALELLEENRMGFFKEYEVDLIKGQIQSTLVNFKEAESYFARISTPEGKRHYIPILLYHGISLNMRSRNMPFHLFESQVKALKDKGYHFITVRDLEKMITGNKHFPEKPILLTFDDGRIDSFQLGDQILAKYNIQATMFIPSSRMIDNHPFFADWNMVRMYAGTGRWDIQSHGYRAHDTIPIDATEQSTGFLVNRQWLEEEERLEREDEYAARLEDDYKESIRRLNDNVPGLNVIGYAYPFSEAGQESVGNEPNAGQWNEQLLIKYFRFGFIQDQAGYNAIDVASKPLPPMMLRRFNVPSTWDGPQLMKHLAVNYPHWLAMENIGQTYFWNGYYERARLIFNQQAAKEPLLKGDTEYFLSQVSYQEGRVKEAQEHLTQAIAESSERAIKNVMLQDQIRWANNVQVKTQFHLTLDSKDRTHQWETIELYNPGTRFPVDFWMEIGQFSFQERDLLELAGQEITMGSRWNGLPGVILDGKVRARHAPEGKNTENIWLHGKYGDDARAIHLHWSYEDVETLSAHDVPLQSHNYDADYRIRFTPRWEGLGHIAYHDYEGGNRQTDLKIGIDYKIPLSNWKIGAIAIQSDSLFDAKRYYTPEELSSGRGVITYRRFWESGGSVTGYGELGISKDPIFGVQPVAYGSVQSIYAWSKQVRSSLEWQYAHAPGYYNGTAALALHYLF